MRGKDQGQQMEYTYRVQGGSTSNRFRRELRRLCSHVGFLHVCMSFRDFFVSGNECLCVVNVEARAAHCGMASTIRM